MHHLRTLTKALLDRIIEAMKAELALIESYLQEHGLLMVVDNHFPSYVTMITKEPIKGSWWGHPKGNFIYNSLNAVLDRPDILQVKLLNKKTTLVQKEHWSALVSLAESESAWQTYGLKQDHLDLLKLVQSKSAIRTDEMKSSKSLTEIGKLASRLEERLLIYSESVHTDSGKHARVLKTWSQTMKEREVSVERISPEEAEMYFDFVLEEMRGDLVSRPHLPWEK
jgi:hypothetical protein